MKRQPKAPAPQLKITCQFPGPSPEAEARYVAALKLLLRATEPAHDEKAELQLKDS